MSSAYGPGPFDFNISSETDSFETDSNNNHPLHESNAATLSVDSLKAGSLEHQHADDSATIISDDRYGDLSQTESDPLSLEEASAINYSAPSVHPSSRQTQFVHEAGLPMSTLSPLRDSSSVGTRTFSELGADSRQLRYGEIMPYHIACQPTSLSPSLLSEPGYPVNFGPLDFETRTRSMFATTHAGPSTRYSGQSTTGHEYVVPTAHVSRQEYQGPQPFCSPQQTSQEIPVLMSPPMEHSLGSNSASRPGPFRPSLETSVPVSAPATPPFENTKSFYALQTNNGQAVKAQITAKIEKGFFKPDDNWVCYRRNYFTVHGAFYTLPSNLGLEPLFIQRSETHYPQIQTFALTISARADNENGKTIDLVQHTPKRDKGPMTVPGRREVKPNLGGDVPAFGTASMAYSSPNHEHEYECGNPNTVDSQTVASFERIQFKRATQNNGKRRAAQQYFHLIVELHAKVHTSSGQEEWVKIAQRASARIVVRGRSPGHYRDERRNPTQTGGGPPGQMGFDGGFHEHFGGGSTDATFGQGANIGDFSRSNAFSGSHPASTRSAFLSPGPLESMLLTPSEAPLRNLSDSYLELENSGGFYTNQNFASLPSPPTPRSAHLQRHSSSNSPGIGYMTPRSLVKEEVRPQDHKSESIRGPKRKAPSSLASNGPSEFGEQVYTPPRYTRPWVALDHRQMGYQITPAGPGLP